MILDNMQQRSWPLHIHGNVMDLENSRPDTFDCFHPVVLPTLLAITGRKMVGIDRRGEFDNIISLDAEKGILYLEENDIYPYNPKAGPTYRYWKCWRTSTTDERYTHFTTSEYIQR